MDDYDKFPTAFQSLVQQKCPRCRQGKCFPNPTYSAKFKVMYDNCPQCGVGFEPEPGFYWGAMYISYAFTVGISIIWGVILYTFFDDPPVPVYLGVIFSTILALSPPLLRYSRIVMLYLFSPIGFDPEMAKKVADK